ncbi:carbonic anhydrase [Lysobacter niabensis]|uniref:carbonic anhydrase n=1 Tax=Agrilutibacter niabensis TaxID=380628 RepID=UPI003606FD74
MKAHTHLAVLLLVLTGVPASAEEHKHASHWEYTGEAGPEHWGELEDDFQLCGSGRNQSPIDLTHFIEADLPPIAFDYQPGGYDVVNNGHTIQVQYKPGSRITLDGTDFELKQLHFHVPSENTIEGKSFPMEAHLVHADAQGHLAVVAVMFEEGRESAWLDKVWPRVPKQADGETELATPLAATDLLPADRDYYRYSGSLTTPPCSEDVRWLVLKQPVKASAAQLAVVGRTLGHANNRPVQPAGARIIVK